MIPPIIISLKILRVLLRMVGIVILAPVQALADIFTIIAEEICKPFVRWMEEALGPVKNDQSLEQDVAK